MGRQGRTYSSGKWVTLDIKDPIPSEPLVVSKARIILGKLDYSFFQKAVKIFYTEILNVFIIKNIKEEKINSPESYR